MAIGHCHAVACADHLLLGSLKVVSQNWGEGSRERAFISAGVYNANDFYAPVIARVDDRDREIWSLDATGLCGREGVIMNWHQ
jgi:hypothetical protein